MFILYADKTQMAVHHREPLVSGGVSIYRVRFQFSGDWDGLDKTAVFQSDGLGYSVLLDETGECAVPWETLARYRPYMVLKVGVYGTKGGEIVLPTVWADLGTVQEGVKPGEATHPPTPGAYEQVLAGLADVRERLEDLEGSGGGTPGNLVIATDEEIREMLDEVFSASGVNKHLEETQNGL